MPKTHLTWKEKLAYGFGENGLSISYTIISFFFLFFLTDVTGLNSALAGSVVLVGKFWDAVTDPLCGYISDKTDTRWGRRRPYFLISALPFGVTFFLLWNSVPIDNQLGLFLYNVVIYLLFTTAFTSYAVPYMSLTPELTPNYDERTGLTAYRMGFSIAGGLVAAAVPLMIVNYFNSQQVGFRVMGGIFAVIIVLSPIVVFFGTRERVKSVQEEVSFRKGVNIVLNNKPFMIMLAVFLFTWVALDIISAVFIYFIKYWLRLGGHESGILAALFISSVLFLPFWVKASEKFGKKTAYISGISSLAIILFLIILLRPGQVIGIYIMAVFAGIGVSTAHVIPYSILPDCIDYGQFKTGEKMEGVYYGFTTFSRKIASSFAIFIVGQILSLTGYIPDQLQNNATLWAIRLILGPGAGLILILGIIFMVKFPITRAKHEVITRRLDLKEIRG